MEDDPDEPQEGVEIEDQSENKKMPGQTEDAEAKKLDDSKLEDPSQEELKVTEKKELTEDDPYEPQEGVEIELQAENKKGKDMQRMLKPKIWMNPSWRTIHRRS